MTRDYNNDSEGDLADDIRHTLYVPLWRIVLGIAVAFLIVFAMPSFLLTMARNTPQTNFLSILFFSGVCILAIKLWHTPTK